MHARSYIHSSYEYYNNGNLYSVFTIKVTQIAFYAQAHKVIGS